MDDNQSINVETKEPVQMKQPKTYEEQVALIKEKGFLVDDEKACSDFLHGANYYRLSAYFLPFRKKDGSYYQGVPFHRIQRIYEFDGKIRNVLFECIEEIEFYLRTQLAYYSGHTYGTLGYLDKDNFSDKHNEERFLSRINGCIEENARTLVVQHHREKYDGKFPIWVIIEFFSMGMLSYFYADMKTEDQKILAKEMYGASVPCLKSWLRCITDLRNRCAHYARLYYWLFPALPKIASGTEYSADHRLFTQIMVLKFLYPDPEKWNTYVMAEINELIEEYRDDISFRHIGFPKNWKDTLQYNGTADSNVEGA